MLPRDDASVTAVRKRHGARWSCEIPDIEIRGDTAHAQRGVLRRAGVAIWRASRSRMRTLRDSPPHAVAARDRNVPLISFRVPTGPTPAGLPDLRS